MVSGLLHPPHLRFLFAASLGVNLLALALPLLTMQVYNRILFNHAVDTLLVLSGGVIAAALIEFVLRVCRSMVVNLNGARFEHFVSTGALAHLMDTEPRTYAYATPTILAQHVNAVARLRDYYGGQMAMTLLVDMPFAILFLGLTFYLTGWLALVPCAVIVGAGWLFWRQSNKLRTMMDAREEQDDRRYDFITDTLQSVHTVKALCLEAVTARRFEETQRASGAVNHRIACTQGSADALSFCAVQFMVVAVVCTGTPMVIGGSISVGTLIACVLLSGQIMQPLQRGLAMWTRHQDIALSRARLRQILSVQPRGHLAPEALGANHGALKINNVRFSYRPGEPVIDGLNLDLAPGDTVSIRSEPGGGRTTLLELMAGVYAPDRGQVLLCDMDVASIPTADRTRYIAYLPTSGLVLRGSIMENLTGFDARLQGKTQEIAALLGIEQSVALLPAGYDTMLEGLTADQIPPGLKQRIAIARALMYKPRLILFDNADQGLDRESYLCVFNLLAKLKGKATMVLVSEDRNIGSLADRSFELRRGHLVPLVETAAVTSDRRWLQEITA
ncbi:MAG: ATP-binding cassette domain-containing protein [Alphaproteobacteria bacterium]|nr:ATP-binding cassette domain-containing protein [Alphaproteobacteria bacterium]